MEEQLMEHIESFLDGKISREDLDVLASKYGEVNLDNEIDWVREARLSIEMAGLREQLKDALSDEGSEKPKVMSMRLWRAALAVAAGITLLLIIYLGLNRGEQEPALYAQYQYIAPNLPMLMSQSEDYQLYDALTYYGEGNYGESEIRLSKISKDNADNDTLNFYLGASLLYNDKANEARVFLKKSAQDNSPFQQKAEWLLVLAALREENLMKAKEELKSILDQDQHEFATLAQELKGDLPNE